MSGFIVAAFAGLLMQQAAPHPSTQEPYRAPAIRPYEPASDFGREGAQGDAEGELHRRPLEAPVPVEAYARSYEFSPTDAETLYDQGVTSAEIRADQAAGPMDGAWRIVDAAGRPLYQLILNDAGAGAAEGGWRGETGAGAAILDDRTLTLEGAGVMTLGPEGHGREGVLIVDGRTQPARLSRPE